jgi:hypothetical protein
MNIRYVIKDYTYDDFSEIWKTNINIKNIDFDLGRVAKQIAEHHYNEDPCDAGDFECVVGIKFLGLVKWFKFTASLSIDFHIQDLNGVDHVLRTDANFLFVETIQEAIVVEDNNENLK